MAEFVLLYRNTPEARREVMRSPERAQQEMNRWQAWIEEMTGKGQLKARGHPLDDAGKVVVGRKPRATDGPYAETKEVVGGYSLIEATDIDAAVKIASGCPVLRAGGSVEVRPVKQLDF